MARAQIEHRSIVPPIEAAGLNPAETKAPEVKAGESAKPAEAKAGTRTTTPVKRVLRIAGREIFYIETINSRYRLEIRSREDAVAENAG